MCTRKSRRSTYFALLACGWMLASTGCSNRAHRDLYNQRISSEARVLEDQLYAADYENRVLRDKLEQYQRKIAESQIPTPAIMKPHDHPGELNQSRRAISSESSVSPTTPQPIADPATDLPLFDMGEGLESDDYDLPMFDEGVPVDEGTLSDPEILPLPTPSTEPRSIADPAPSAAPKLGTPKATAPQRPSILPAPGGPVPPGKQDTEIPPVIEGEVLPPPAGGKDDKPPGQIILPDFTSSHGVLGTSGAPEKLMIHQTLSVGHHTDGKLDGAVIVVSAVDGEGNPVDMNAFDIDADMSVVVLDPTRTAEEARIGRWDFTARQIVSMVRDHPVKGIHIPIQWQDDVPDGDHVVVHVRLKGDDMEMRCEGELALGDQPAITDWTPRGSKTLR